MITVPRRAVAVLTTVVALAVVQLALGMYYWLPGLSLAEALSPTWDLLVVVGLLLAWSFVPLKPRAAHAAVDAVLTLVLTAATILGFGQGFARREFGYDVNITFHKKYVAVLVEMLYDAEPVLRFSLYMALAVLAILAAIAVLCASARHLRRVAARSPRHRKLLAAGVAAYIALAGLGLGMNGPLASIGAAEIDLAVNRGIKLRETGRALAAEASTLRAPNPLAGSARRPHILFLVIESYGSVAYEGEAFDGFRERARTLLGELTASGYHVRSRYLEAPVFGGSSWLANVTMLCGANVSTELRYEALYRSRVRCLPSDLGDAGYHTVYAAANTTYLEWRVTEKLPFDAFYTRASFDYRGPRFAWSFMPDQYVLHSLFERELSPLPEQPVFAHVALTSSHHPWRKIPPLLDDWSEIGDGSVFQRASIVKFEGNRFLTGNRYVEAYGKSIEYSLAAIAAFLQRLPADADLLAVVVGDHQPRKPIGYHERDAWTVPVHVLSRRADLVDGFAELGYVPGLHPRVEAEPPGLRELPSQLMRGLGATLAPASEPFGPRVPGP